MTHVLSLFAGNSWTLFLISQRKYSFRMTLSIWMGAFFSSALLSVLAYVWFPAGASMFSQAISLALCGPVFLTTSQGSFLKKCWS